MSLPPRYSGMPEEEQHNFFRDICIEFKKTIKSTKDSEELEYQMQRFMDGSREIRWPEEKTAIFHKSEYEKAAKKVWTEFKRYDEALKKDKNTSPQDLIDAINNIESMLGRLKVR